MRIPAEVLPLYRPERNAAAPGPRAAQPVGESARLASTLAKSEPNPLPARRADLGKERRRPDGEDEDSERSERGEGDRQGDRRKARQQVLIDTRAARGRRDADSSTAIDVIV